MYALGWPGSRALARLVLDGRIPVAGRRVLDAGCGSGLTAAAVALRGGQVTAADLDRLALLATAELARRHGLTVTTLHADVLGPAGAAGGWHTVLAGDLVYDAESGQRVAAAVTRWQDGGAQVWLCDGGRPFFHPAGLALRWEGTLPVPRGVEGTATRVVRVHGPPGEAWHG
jgi:predicted nicotinamide N-methyase